MKTITSAVVKCTLWLDEHCAYWLIPYPMRGYVGQTPRHLHRAGNTHGWQWCGTRGWFGHLPAALIEECRRLQADPEGGRDLHYVFEFTELELDPGKYPLLHARMTEWKPRGDR